MINGVFLVALCLSIFLEAIQRLVEPQMVSNPRLVFIVGCCGLMSNILGLFLFHDHGHAHGGGGGDHAKSAEEGRHRHVKIADEASGDVADAGHGGDSSASTLPVSNGHAAAKRGPSAAPDSSPKPTTPEASRHHRHGSASRRPFTNVDDINMHPASFRFEIIRAANMQEDEDSAEATDSDNEHATVQEEDEDEGQDERDAEEQTAAATEQSPLLSSAREQRNPNLLSPAAAATTATPERTGTAAVPNGYHRPTAHDSWHKGHRHSSSKSSKGGHGHSGHAGHGHSHSDLNMRGVFLHVLGDALGNVGVIASALLIWLTTYTWRYYADPLISLLITLVILASALPLCTAAARILLQAVPVGIDVDDIRADIEELPGVLGCHHLHVWQLSGTKLVASLHIQVDFDFEGTGSARYMELARAVRSCLHAYQIHSSTIQPEFRLDPARLVEAQAAEAEAEAEAGTGTGAGAAARQRLRGLGFDGHDHDDHGHDHDHSDGSSSNGDNHHHHHHDHNSNNNHDRPHNEGAGKNNSSAYGGSGVGVSGSTGRRSNRTSRLPSRAGSSRSGSATACLLECGDECGDGGQCCAPGTTTTADNGTANER